MQQLTGVREILEEEVLDWGYIAWQEIFVCVSDQYSDWSNGLRYHWDVTHTNKSILIPILYLFLINHNTELIQDNMLQTNPTQCPCGIALHHTLSLSFLFAHAASTWLSTNIWVEPISFCPVIKCEPRGMSMKFVVLILQSLGCPHPTGDVFSGSKTCSAQWEGKYHASDNQY